MRIVLEYPRMLQDLVEAEPILWLFLQKLYSIVRKGGSGGYIRSYITNERVRLLRNPFR